MTNEAKPRVEVTEETTERLDVLELDRTPRPEKLAREAALLEGASEVRFFERAFRPRHASEIDDVRRRVDALEVSRRALPEVPPLPPSPVPVAASRREPSEDERRALAGVVDGRLVGVEHVYRTEAGHVVEATWDAREGRRTGTFVIRDGRARPIDDIASRVDAMPDPEARPPAPATERAVPTPPIEDSKPRRFGLPRRKEKPSDAAPPAQRDDAAAEPKKKRFGFGRK